MKYKYLPPSMYRSPIALPEGKSGNVEVKHVQYPAGHELPVIGIRSAFLTKRKPTVVQLSNPLRVHFLSDEAGVWMTDLPEELQQMAEAMHNAKPRGRVLVGGLGLGILAKSVSMLPEVEQVMAVEVSQDVLNLCSPRKGEYLTYQDDIAQFLEYHKQPYDCYMLDTWQMTSENTWWSTVMPLKRIIRNKFGMKPKIWCWAEEIMRGQVEWRLETVTTPHWYYHERYSRISREEAEWFCHQVGSREWERRYGAYVDEVIAAVTENKEETEHA